MSILEAIKQLSFDYEVKTGSKLKGIDLSGSDFDKLLVELDDKRIAYECRLRDPYCWIMIDGVKIGWDNEIKDLNEWSYRKHSSQKLVADFASSMDDVFRNALKEIKK
jgi:hypothetical protein